MSFTTSTSTCRSVARCSARRTRGSSNGLRFMLKKYAWMTDWFIAVAVTPGISLALRQETGSMIRA